MFDNDYVKFIARVAVVGLAVALLGGLAWYMFWVNYVANGNLPYTFDKVTGKVEVYPHNGWVIATPWLKDVHAIDIRPNQVCMNANSRVLNCKLVQFNPHNQTNDPQKIDPTNWDGFNTFIKWHGVGAGEETRVYEILKSYAFNVNEGRDCPFLVIIDDMRRHDRPADLLALSVTEK